MPTILIAKPVSRTIRADACGVGPHPSIRLRGWPTSPCQQKPAAPVSPEGRWGHSLHAALRFPLISNPSAFSIAAGSKSLSFSAIVLASRALPVMPGLVPGIHAAPSSGRQARSS